MMKYNEIATATLDQLTDELAAAGWESTHTEIIAAREAVVNLLIEVRGLYALVSDCTPNCGTIEMISDDASDIHDAYTDDTWRVIRLLEFAAVGDRISIDWDEQAVGISGLV
jgi:pheromone shutdown protein TraB